MSTNSANSLNDNFLSKSSDEVRTDVNFKDTTSMTFTQSIDPFEKHEQILTKDVICVGSSNDNFEDTVEKGIEMEEVTRKGTRKPRKKRIRWTTDEHKLFLKGLDKEGFGEWKVISEKYVISKTPTQIASHAQKFKQRNTKTPQEKLRTSINDISSDFQPSQSRLVLDSLDLPPNQHTFSLDTQKFQSNEFNLSSNPKHWLPNKLINFSLDSQYIETNQFGKATASNHVRNNH